MRLPREAYPIQEALAAYRRCLRPAQVQGLTWWVYGTILASSACQCAILLTLRPLGAGAALHQRVREWLYDEAAKAVPSSYQVEETACFPRLLRWILSWWQGRELAVALDATSLGDRLIVRSLHWQLFHGRHLWLTRDPWPDPPLTSSSIASIRGLALFPLALSANPGRWSERDLSIAQTCPLPPSSRGR